MATLMKILAMAMAVQIALSDHQCECTIKGDPHVDPFMGSRYSLPLPCGHTIVGAQIAAPPGPNTADCVIQARGLAEYADGLNGVSFERLIQFKVFYNLSSVDFIFDGAAFPDHVLKGQLPNLEAAGITIHHFPNLGGQSTVTIEPCHIKLTYKPRESSFTLEMPMSTHFEEGVCGNCNELWGGTTSPSTEVILNKTLQCLNADVTVKGQPLNIYPVCNNLTRSVQSCQWREVAEDNCGPILEHDVRTCINKAGNSNTEALEKFEECFSTLCSVAFNSLDCTSFLEGIFYDCAPQHIIDNCGGDF